MERKARMDELDVLRGQGISGHDVFMARALEHHDGPWSPARKVGTSDEAQKWISRKIRKLINEGKERDQAAAIAYSMARDKGYDVPEKKSSLLVEAGMDELFQVIKLEEGFRDRPTTVGVFVDRREAQVFVDRQRRLYRGDAEFKIRRVTDPGGIQDLLDAHELYDLAPMEKSSVWAKAAATQGIMGFFASVPRAMLNKYIGTLAFNNWDEFASYASGLGDVSTRFYNVVDRAVQGNMTNKQSFMLMLDNEFAAIIPQRINVGGKMFGLGTLIPWLGTAINTANGVATLTSLLGTLGTGGTGKMVIQIYMYLVDNLPDDSFEVLKRIWDVMAQRLRKWRITDKARGAVGLGVQPGTSAQQATPQGQAAQQGQGAVPTTAARKTGQYGAAIGYALSAVISWVASHPEIIAVLIQTLPSILGAGESAPPPGPRPSPKNPAWKSKRASQQNPLEALAAALRRANVPAGQQLISLIASMVPVDGMDEFMTELHRWVQQHPPVVQDLTKQSVLDSTYENPQMDDWTQGGQGRDASSDGQDKQAVMAELIEGVKQVRNDQQVFDQFFAKHADRVWSAVRRERQGDVQDLERQFKQAGTSVQKVLQDHGITGLFEKSASIVWGVSLRETAEDLFKDEVGRALLAALPPVDQDGEPGPPKLPGGGPGDRETPPGSGQPPFGDNLPLPTPPGDGLPLPGLPGPQGPGSPRTPGGGMGASHKVAATNDRVIMMFLDDAFPKDKMPEWGAENLKIKVRGKGDYLYNYNAPMLYRDAATGEVWFNAQRYSVTTSNIQNTIRRAAQDRGIQLREVQEREMPDDWTSPEMRQASRKYAGPIGKAVGTGVGAAVGGVVIPGAGAIPGGYAGGKIGDFITGGDDKPQGGRGRSTGKMVSSAVRQAYRRGDAMDPVGMPRKIVDRARLDLEARDARGANSLEDDEELAILNQDHESAGPDVVKPRGRRTKTSGRLGGIAGAAVGGAAGFLGTLGPVGAIPGAIGGYMVGDRMTGRGDKSEGGQGRGGDQESADELFSFIDNTEYLYNDKMRLFNKSVQQRGGRFMAGGISRLVADAAQDYRGQFGRTHGFSLNEGTRRMVMREIEQEFNEWKNSEYAPQGGAPGADQGRYGFEVRNDEGIMYSGREGDPDKAKGLAEEFRGRHGGSAFVTDTQTNDILHERHSDEEPGPGGTKTSARPFPVVKLAKHLLRRDVDEINRFMTKKVAEPLLSPEDRDTLKRLRQGGGPWTVTDRHEHNVIERTMLRDHDFDLWGKTRGNPESIVGLAKQVLAPDDARKVEMFVQTKMGQGLTTASLVKQAVQRDISALSHDRAQNSRPRLLASKSDLINRAANILAKGITDVGKGMVFRDLCLASIVPRSVGSTGLMIEGEMLWNVKAASPRHKRARRLTLVMPVVAGEPQVITVFKTAAGQDVAFKTPELERYLRIRQTVVTGKRPPGIMIAYAG